jgi:coproporphyrinogen III oxidase-like Fe-S oxidoreductase
MCASESTAAWTNALLADLDRQAEAGTGTSRSSRSFFGGGTPSLMPPETAAALIERVKRHWRTAPEFEITLEANPNSAEAERFAGFATAGVNRLSLGVQALDPKALTFLGRGHDRGEAIAAIKLSRELFSRTSFDLIYARPGQSVVGVARELDEALALAGRALVALPADDRARHRVSHARSQRRVRCAR